MSENTIEEIDKDSLLALLKEKGKEIKTLENKNKKLEERYVKIFRENKNLTKDKDTLEKLLQVIFKDQQRFTNVESGSYDLAVLTELWNQRNGELSKLSTDSQEIWKKEKAELVAEFEKKLKTLEEDLTKASSQGPEIEKKVEGHKNHLLELEKANEKLVQEIKDLNEVIEERDQQIGKLKNAEYEIEALKAELLMKELELKNFHDNLNIKAKMQENDRKNEVLRLRQEVEILQSKVKEFEAERQYKLENSRSQHCQTESIQIPLSPPRLDSASRLNESGSSDTLAMRKESEGLPQFTDSEQINQEYLKNVILKLFCYIEGNNVKEARALMNALCIMLRMSAEDKEKIEDARRNNTLWTNTVHFLKDTFTGGKGDVNYYTNGIESK